MSKISNCLLTLRYKKSKSPDCEILNIDILNIDYVASGCTSMVFVKNMQFLSKICLIHMRDLHGRGTIFGHY